MTLLDKRIGSRTSAKTDFGKFIILQNSDFDAALVTNAKMIVCNHPTFSTPVILGQNQVKITTALEDRMKAMFDLLLLLVHVYMYENKSD